MKDLNEKLAKWAGFKFYGITGNIGDPDWIDPAGNKCWLLPDFPNDLNACFERLEPELYRRGLRYQLSRLQDGHMVQILEPGKGWAESVASAVDKKPATAFCKAVEQLMGKE